MKIYKARLIKQITSLLLVAVLALLSVRSYSQCTALFSANKDPLQGCEVLTVQFFDQSANVLSRIWDFGDGTATVTAQNPVHSFNAGKKGDTTYVVRLTITCASGTSSATKSVSVYAQPKIDFSSNKSSVCAITDSICLTNLTGYNPQNTYLWNFGDGTASNKYEPCKIYSTPGTYTITLSVTNIRGCLDTKTKTNFVKVEPVPSTAFSVNSSSGCLPFIVTFTNTTDLSQGEFKLWTWDFGDGSPKVLAFNPPQHTYTAAGEYKVTLGATNNLGCYNFSSQTISVKSSPVAAFAASTPICENGYATFTFTGTYTNLPVFTWKFDSPSAVTGPAQGPRQVKWDLPGTKTITLTVDEGGCTSSFSDKVQVVPVAKPYIELLEFGDTVCTGETVTFTSMPAGYSNYRFYVNSNLVKNSSENFYTGTGFSDGDKIFVRVTDAVGCSEIAANPLTLHVLQTPAITLTSSAPGNSICKNGSITLTALPNSYPSYSFYVNNQLVQSGAANSFTSSNLSDKDLVYATATFKVCESAVTQPIAVNVIDLLPAPQVYCGTSTLTSVEFRWDAVKDATQYEVSVNNSSFASPSSGSAGLSHIVTGLTAGDNVKIIVRARNSSPCEVGIESQEVTCSPIICTGISYTQVNQIINICQGENALLEIKDINVASYSVEWNGEAPSAELKYTYLPTGSTMIPVKVYNLSQTLCPPVEKKFDIRVTPKSLVKINSSAQGDSICTDGSVTFTVSPANLENYDFYNNGLLLQSGPFNSYTATGIKSTQKYYVKASNGTCELNSDTLSLKVIERLRTPQVVPGASTNTSATFEWDQVQGAKGYVVSVNNGPFISPSTGNSGLQHTVTSMKQGQAVTLTVMALGKEPCGNSNISQPATGYAEQCPYVTFSLETSYNICKGDSVKLAILDINITDYTVKWGSMAPSRARSVWVKPLRDTIIAVSVKSEGRLLCPPVTRYVEITVGNTPDALTMTSSDPDNRVCLGESIKFTANPGGYDSYIFLNNGQLLNESSFNEWSSDGSKPSYKISAKAVNDGCVSPLSNIINAATLSKLNTPQVNTGTTTTSTVSFEWDTIPGAVGYQVSINSGAYISPSSGPTGLTHTVTGLNPGDPAIITVIAIGNPDCSNSLPSNPLTGNANNCGGITFKILPYQSICENVIAGLKVSDINVPNYSISWNSGTYGNTSLMTLTAKKDTIVTVNVRDDDNPGCPAALKYFDIKVKKVVPVSLISDAIKDTICEGNVLNLMATAGFERYVFIDNTTVLQDSAINYYKSSVLSTNNNIFSRVYQNGCLSETNQISTTVVKLPELTISASKSGKICKDEPVEFTFTPGFKRYVVSNGVSDLAQSSTNQITLPVSDTVYTVTGFNDRNCSVASANKISFEVLARPATSISCSADSICLNETATFYSLPKALVKYDFFKNNVMVQTSAATSYVTDSLRVGDIISVIGFDSNGCASQPSVSAFPFVLPSPDTKILASADGVCLNSSATLYMVKDPAFLQAQYYWSTGQTTETISVTPLLDTKYSLFYSDLVCKDVRIADKTIVVDRDPAPDANAGPDVTICIKDSIRLNASGGKSYLWNSNPTLNPLNVSDPYAKPEVTTVYTVTVTNQYCKDVDSVKITVDLCLEGLTDPVPQIISPNDDGINDFLVIYNVDYFTENSIVIYNRWGNRVYSAKPYDNTWSGKSDKGEPLPDGTYFWVLDLGNGNKAESGYIVIHR